MNLDPQILILSLSLLVAFIITYAAIPSIITVSRLKNLSDEPDERRVHKVSVPTLGGVAIFAGLMVSILIFSDFSDFYSLKYLLAGVIIMFFVGIKDDILMIAAGTKFMLQILAASIVVILGNIQITNFHGFFGIHEIPMLIGIPISIFAILIIINAFNFIDGIDGFSGTIGIVIVSTFGIWFYLVGDYSYTIVCGAMIGGLTAFLRFNLFSVDNKIFMGDTGTLILGLIISVLAIHFSEKNIELPYSNPYHILPAPAVALGILIVPLFDLMRIIYIRLIIRKPIFLPDKRHIHHIFLELGFSHKKTVAIIATANILFIILIFWLSDFVTIRRLILIILILGSVLSSIPKIILERRNKKNHSNHSE